MSQQDNWYSIRNIDALDTPALVVYPDRIKANINLLKRMIDDVSRLRPHIKTHKSPEVTKLMLQAGLTKFKCATIAEAEMLGQCHAPDVLLAYQPLGPKLLRFLELIRTYPETKYACLVDHLQAAQAISDKAVSHNLQVRVYIDLNIGMNRTGIKPDEHALQLYRDCNKLPGIHLMGLHAYDGHIHDTDIGIRTEKTNACFEPVLALQQQLINEGFDKPVIIAGGTPTFPIHAKRAEVECSPGTFVYWDRGYQLMLPEQAFLPAALVVVRVLSLPDENKITLDIGHKSVSAENPIDKRIYFINAPELKAVSQSEEHLVVEVPSGHNYKPGDLLYGLPYHVCPTIALYELAIVIEDHQVAGEWKNTARDRKITI